MLILRRFNLLVNNLATSQPEPELFSAALVFVKTELNCWNPSGRCPVIGIVLTIKVYIMFISFIILALTFEVRHFTSCILSYRSQRIKS